MVWSEQVGTSIILPSDRVDGDGRNYIVIGEDVPSAIADSFTAALVFRNGKVAGSDPAPGANFDPTGAFGNLYPNGFVYYALGISKAGNLELVSFYFVVPSPRSEAYSTYRQTVLSIAAPVGVDNPPVVSIGQNPNYGSYNEGAVKVVVQSPSVVSLNIIDTANFGPYSAPYGGPIATMTESGLVVVSGVLLIKALSFTSGARLAQLPDGWAPATQHIFTCQGFNARSVRIDVAATGEIIYNGTLTDNTVSGVGQYFSLAGIAFQKGV